MVGCVVVFVMLGAFVLWCVWFGVFGVYHCGVLLWCVVLLCFDSVCMFRVGVVLELIVWFALLCLCLLFGGCVVLFCWVALFIVCVCGLCVGLVCFVFGLCWCAVFVVAVCVCVCVCLLLCRCGALFV